MTDECSFTGFAHCSRCGDVIPAYRRLCNDCRRIAGVGESLAAPDGAGQAGTKLEDIVRAHGDGTAGDYETDKMYVQSEAQLPPLELFGFKIRTTDEIADFILTESETWASKDREDIRDVLIGLAEKVRRLK